MSVSGNERNSCLTIGRMAPYFTALSTDGIVTLSQYRGKWVVIISEPGNFASTSTSSLIALSTYFDEFAKINVQILVVTIDNNFSNIEWKMNIFNTYGIIVPFPILEDRDAQIANMYGMVNPDRIYEESVRDIFIINPQGRIKAIFTYPVSCGRNTFEILRIIDSLQLTDAYNVYTPANWIPGDPVVLPTTQNFNEAMLRQQGQSGFNCPNWYTCYLDYNSLTQRDNISELKKRS